MTLFYWFRLLHYGVEDGPPECVGALRGVRRPGQSPVSVLVFRSAANDEGGHLRSAVLSYRRDPNDWEGLPW